MQTVLFNAVILCGEELEPTKGYLVIKEGRISKISSGMPSVRGVDLKNAIVMPPFVNAHTHVGDAAGKDLYLGRPHKEAVGPEGIKFQIFEKFSKSKRREAIAQAISELKRMGTIAHVDFREEGVLGVELLRECMDKHLRSVILGRGKTMAELKEVLRVADGIGLPSVRVLSQKSLKRFSSIVSGKGKHLAAHVAETAEDERATLSETGKSEVRLAVDAGLSFVVHATHCSSDDLELLKKSGIPVVFCCRSNLLLSAGVPPIAAAIHVGLKFFLGTDNVMVNRPSMFEELHFALACARLRDSKIGAEEAKKILISATTEPARFLSLSCSRLEEGAPATFLVLSRGNNLRHLSDLHSGIVSRAGEDNLNGFFVEGKNILEES